MLPLIPKSVKMDAEVSTLVKHGAGSIGYSENQLIVESVKSTIALAADANDAMPRLVMLLRAAQNHQMAPPHLNNLASKGSTQKLTNSWWGT